MIVVDASAILAILFDEAEASLFAGHVVRAGGAIMSPVNHWEALARSHVEGGAEGRRRAEALLARLNVTVIPLDGASARAAADAFERYGKGQGGPLNLGDCFAYALAAEHGEGLLFKGDDFPKTDIRSALA
jgi:ribonuclease VapC